MCPVGRIGATKNNLSIFNSIREEWLRIGDVLFEHSDTARSAWKCMEERLRRQGFHWYRRDLRNFFNCSAAKQKYIVEAKQFIPNAVEVIVEELRQVFERQNRKRDDDVLEVARIVEERWNEWLKGDKRKRAIICEEIKNCLSTENVFLQYKGGLSMVIWNCLRDAKKHYEKYRAGASIKPFSKADIIFLRLQRISVSSQGVGLQKCDGETSQNSATRRIPFKSIGNSPTIDENNDCDVAVPSRTNKRYRRSSSNQSKNRLVDDNNNTNNNEEDMDSDEAIKRRKRLEEDQRITEENEKRFGKRPEYGTRAYFEWVARLYGMPPTASNPEKAKEDESNGDEEEGWDDDDEFSASEIIGYHPETDNNNEGSNNLNADNSTYQYGNNKNDNENTNAKPLNEAICGTASFHNAPQSNLNIDESASDDLASIFSASHDDTSKEYIDSIIRDVLMKPMEPPRTTPEQRAQLREQLKIEEMELKIEAMRIETEQRKLQIWYVIQASQREPPPLAELMEEATKRADEMEEYLRQRGVPVKPWTEEENNHEDIDDVRYVFENGEYKTYREL